jgi:ATP-dependent Clp protease adaptor protein ClpS
MSEEGPTTDVMVATKPKETTKTRRVPPYNVILLNDDDHSMEFVIEVLCKALGYTVERSYQLMMQAHTSGRTIVWTGPKEVAELKADQIRTFHEKRDDGRNFGPFLKEFVKPTRFSSGLLRTTSARA